MAIIKKYWLKAGKGTYGDGNTQITASDLFNDNESVEQIIDDYELRGILFRNLSPNVSQSVNGKVTFENLGGIECINVVKSVNNGNGSSGIKAFNLSTDGSALEVSTLGIGAGISLFADTISGTGNVFEVHNNRSGLIGSETLFIKKEGDITANSYIKSGATNDDILLGDGTTTSLSSLISPESLQVTTDAGNTTTNDLVLNKTGDGSQSILFDTDGHDFSISTNTVTSRGITNSDLLIKKNGVDIMNFSGISNVISIINHDFSISGISNRPLKLINSNSTASVDLDLSLLTGVNRTATFPDKSITFADAADVPYTDFYSRGFSKEKEIGNIISIGKGVGRLGLITSLPTVIGQAGVDFTNTTDFDSPAYYNQATVVTDDGEYRYIEFDSFSNATSGTISQIYTNPDRTGAIGNTWDLLAGSFEYYPYFIPKPTTQGVRKGEVSFSSGIGNTLSGTASAAFGQGLYARSNGELVAGEFSTDYTHLSLNPIDNNDRLFNIGNGTSVINRSDAFTVLRNGRVGIGFNNFEQTLNPEALQVNGVIRSEDTPSQIKLAGDKAVTTLEYKRFGTFDYNDNATSTTPIVITGGGGYVFLTNDELGSFTNKLYPPTGVSDIWDASLNQFDFTELNLGSIVHYRLDVSITTTSVNQEVDIALDLGIGASPYTLTVKRDEFKSAGTYNIVKSAFIYMGDANTRDNPAKFKIQSDSNATVVVNGWACAVHNY